MNKTLTFCSSALALALVAGPMLAADLPSIKVPTSLPPPLPMWTGFYGGVNVGGAFGGSTGVATNGAALINDAAGASVFGAPTIFGVASAASAANTVSMNNSGVIGGGQFGYNYQFSDNLLAGMEADIHGATISSVISATGVATEAVSGVPMVSTSTISRNLDYVGTVRAHLGYLATPTLLLYATAGFAWGDATFANSLFQTTLDPLGRVGTSLARGAFSDALFGWTAGVGVEWMFLPNWSAKAEYLYYDLGSVSATTATAGSDPTGVLLYAAAVRSTTHFDGQIVRLGLNYHFHWGAPAPVIAKY